MSAYLWLVAVHVLVAILGLGGVMAIPIFGATALRRSEGPAAREALAGLLPLIRFARAALGLMLITGISIELLAHGAHRREGWFLASLALLVGVGFSLSRVAGKVKATLEGTGELQASLRGIRAWGWTVCLFVGLIAVLMQAKPF